MILNERMTLLYCFVTALADGSEGAAFWWGGQVILAAQVGDGEPSAGLGRADDILRGQRGALSPVECETLVRLQQRGVPGHVREHHRNKATIECDNHDVILAPPVRPRQPAEQHASSSLSAK